MEGEACLTCAPQGLGPSEVSKAHRFLPAPMPTAGKLLLKAGGCGGQAGRQASANTFKSEVTDKAIYGDSLASDHFPQGSRHPSAPLLASPSRRSLNHWLGAVAQGQPGAGLLRALQTAAGMKGGLWLAWGEEGDGSSWQILTNQSPKT